jgi:hypothetical protein
MYIRANLLHYCTKNDYLVNLFSTRAYIFHNNVLMVGETSGSCSSGHVLCDVIPCRLVNCYRRFEEVRCLHFRVQHLRAHPYYRVSPDVLSLVGDPLPGNGCGSPNHT